jgi:hypothetical protein
MAHDSMTVFYAMSSVGYMCGICKKLMIERSSSMLAHEYSTCQEQATDNQGTSALHLSKTIGVCF